VIDKVSADHQFLVYPGDQMAAISPAMTMMQSTRVTLRAMSFAPVVVVNAKAGARRRNGGAGAMVFSTTFTTQDDLIVL